MERHSEYIEVNDDEDVVDEVVEEVEENNKDRGDDTELVPPMDDRWRKINAHLENAYSKSKTDGFSTALDNLIRNISVYKTTDAYPPSISLKELISNPPKVPKTIIEGLLHEKHTLAINAPSKSLKSFLLCNLALCLASGGLWLGKFKCAKCKVLLLNYEIDGGIYYAHRLLPIVNKLHMQMSDIDDNFRLKNLRGSKVVLESIIEEIKLEHQKYGVDVVIIDPFYKMLNSQMRKNIDENSNSDMAYILNEVSTLIKSDVTPIWSGHFAKGQSSFGKPVSDRAAGAGSQGRDPDAIVSLVPLETETKILAFRMEFSVRNFPPIEPIDLRWDYPIHVYDGAYSNCKPKAINGRPEKVNVSNLIKYWVDNNINGELDINELAEEFDLSLNSVRNKFKMRGPDLHNFKIKNGILFGDVDVESDGNNV